MLLYRILLYTISGKIQKIHRKTINLKYQLRRQIMNLNYLMKHILYQIFKIILIISSKNTEQQSDNPQIRIYVNKIENKIILRIKTDSISNF